MSVVINFKTDPKIKKEAQKIAKEMGISLSAILNMYLRKVVKEKKIETQIDSWDNLTDESKEAIYEAQADREAGRLESYSPDKAIEVARAIING